MHIGLKPHGVACASPDPGLAQLSPLTKASPHGNGEGRGKNDERSLSLAKATAVATLKNTANKSRMYPGRG